MEQYTVRVAGRDLTEVATDGPPDISTPQQLELCAFAVHRAVLQRAGTTAAEAQTTHWGRPGYQWEGSVGAVTELLWPWLAERQAGSAEIRRELRAYLRDTGNLVCLQRSGPEIWFAAREWKPGPPQGQPEKKVCTWPAEGGICGFQAATLRWLNRHIFSDHRPAESWLTEAMTALGRPATIGEIFDLAAGAGDFPGSIQHAGNLLRAMADGGEVSHTRDGYTALFWLPGAQPAQGEPDDDPEAVMHWPCREPGCGRREFTSPRARGVHEDTVHAVSAARTWPCPLCDDGRRFYESGAVATHLSRHHGLPGGSEAYTRAWNRAVDAYSTAPAPPAPPAAAADFGGSPEQVGTWLAGMVAEVNRLKDENRTLTAEKQQLAARLRRIGPFTEEE